MTFWLDTSCFSSVARAMSVRTERHIDVARHGALKRGLVTQLMSASARAVAKIPDGTLQETIRHVSAMYACSPDLWAAIEHEVQRAPGGSISLNRRPLTCV